MRLAGVLVVAALLLPRMAAAEPHVIDLALSRGSNCALTDDGKVYCWNVERVFVGVDKDYAKVLVPTLRPSLGKSKDVAIGDQFGCALDHAGVVRCWGKNDHGQRARGRARGELPADMPDPGEAGVNTITGDLRFQSLTAATWHICGITTNAKVACWGANFRKQSGGDKYAVAAPRLVKGLSNVEELALGEHYSCARTRAGRVSCWGDPFSKGEEAAEPKPLAIRVPLAKAISGDDGGACALTKTGELWCWGNKLKKIALPAAADAIAGHECVVIAGRVHCRGGTADSLEGRGYVDNPTQRWVVVPGLSDVRKLGARSGSHGCAITGAGALRCFGYRSHVGAGYRDVVDKPVDVVGLSDVTQIAVDHVSCALRRNGTVWCWGGNENDTARAREIPGVRATLVATSGARGCALRADGKITCWERGDDAAPKPAKLVTAVSDVRTFSTGDNHTCAITKVGVVSCWGKNYNGEIGVLPTVEYPKPIDHGRPVAGIVGATAVACGSCSTCASDAGGVWCWGCNSDGQVGNGLLQKRAKPERVVDMGAVKALSVGGEISCATEPSGRVRCWGKGALTPITWHRELEHVSAGDRRACAVTEKGDVLCGMPGAASKVDGIGGAVAIGVDYKHACALLRNGKVRCWGSRGGGVLGDAIPDFVRKAVAPRW